MSPAPTFRSRYIVQRLQARKGNIDLVLKDVEREQDICRRETRRLIVEFKNWQPKGITNEHTPCAQAPRGA